MFGTFNRKYGSTDFEVAVVHQQSGRWFWVTAGPHREDVLSAALIGIDQVYKDQLALLGEVDSEVQIVSRSRAKMSS